MIALMMNAAVVTTGAITRTARVPADTTAASSTSSTAARIAIGFDPSSAGITMLAFERTFYRLAIFASFLGIVFAFLKDSPMFALFDAGMGAWFTKCLMETKR